MNSNRSSAEQSLSTAFNLLAARDFVGSKRYATLALDSNRILSDDRADQILAISDVLLASHRHRPFNPYSILQLPLSPQNPVNLIKSHCRRLSLLLHPDRNRLPGADAALSLVNDAYNILSDPIKKAQLDANLFNSNGVHNRDNDDDSGASAAEIPSFWTICSFCRHLFLYERSYKDKTLLCEKCRKSFLAVELETPPHVVPGTDMYYAVWGFYPVGFANPESTDWTPFASSHVPGSMAERTDTHVNSRKTAGRKKVVGRPRKNVVYGNGVGEAKQEEEVARGININEVAKGMGEEDIHMMMDLDATDVMFESLHSMPFMS